MFIKKVWRLLCPGIYQKRGPIFRRPFFFGAFFFVALSVLAQERKKEATRTWREQDPKP